MKTNLLKSALLIASLFGAVRSAAAETVHAYIPFEFFANAKAMPAGAYTVRSMSGSPSVLLFVNDVTGEKAFAFARSAQDTRGKSALAFTIKTAERTYELSRTPSLSSTKGASIALTLAK